MTLKYEVETITQTCGACPSQWEGKLKDGRMFYIRYRWGTLSFRIAGKPTDYLSEVFQTKPVFDESIGDSLDGFITLNEVKAVLKLNEVVLS